MTQPLGQILLGSHRMEDVCTHALHIAYTDIGLRPAACQNYSYNKSQRDALFLNFIW